MVPEENTKARNNDMQVTHRPDEGGRMIQIVSPEDLRRILQASGDTIDRPKDFGPDDEWFV